MSQTTTHTPVTSSSKVSRILGAFQRKQRYVTAKKITLIDGAKDLLDRAGTAIVDKARGKKGPEDFNLRRERLIDLLDRGESNALFKDAIETARTALKQVNGGAEATNTNVDRDFKAEHLKLAEISNNYIEACTTIQQKKLEVQGKNPNESGILLALQAMLDERAMPEAEHTGLQGRLTAVDNAFAKGAAVDTLRQRIQTLSTDIQNAKGLAEREITARRQRHDGLLVRVANGTFATDKLQHDTQRQLDAADSAIRTYDYDLADNRMTEAETAMRGVVVVVVALLTPEQVDKVLEKLAKDIVALHKEVAIDLELSGSVLDMMTRQDGLREMRRQNVGALAKDIVRLADGLTDEAKDIRAALSWRSKSAETVRQRIQAFDKKCFRTSQMASDYYETASGESGITGPIHEEIEALRERLMKDSAGTEADAERAWQQVNQELQEIEEKLDRNPPLDCAKEFLLFTTQASLFQDAIKRLDEQASLLMLRNSDQAGKLGLMTKPPGLRSKGEQLVQQATADPKATNQTQIDAIVSLIEQIEELRKQAEAKLKEKAPAPDDLWRQTQALVGGYTLRIDTAIKGIKENTNKLFGDVARSDATKKGLEIYAKVLKSDLSVLAAPAANGVSTDIVLLNETLAAVKAFVARVVAFENMKTSKLEQSTSGKNTFGNAEELIKTLEKELSQSLLAGRPEITAPWTEVMETYKTKLYKSDPAVAVQALTEASMALKNELQVAKVDSKRAGVVVDLLDDMASKLVIARDQKQSPVGRQLAASANAVDALLRDLDRESAQVGQVGKANEPNLTALNKRFALLSTLDPAKILARKEENDKSLKETGEYNAAMFNLEELLLIDILLLEERAQGLSGEERKALQTQLKDMRTAVDSAVKTLKKDRNCDAAEAMRQAIASRLKKMAARPLGTTKLNRNQVAKANTLWETDVSAVYAQLMELGTGADTYLKELVTMTAVTQTKADEIKQALDVLIQTVKNSLKIDAFAGAIKRMVNAGSDADKLLDAREDALREIRRLRRVLTGSKDVRMLAGTKLDPKPAFDGLLNTLFVLETNLLTSDV